MTSSRSFSYIFGREDLHDVKQGSSDAFDVFFLTHLGDLDEVDEVVKSTANDAEILNV